MDKRNEEIQGKVPDAVWNNRGRGGKELILCIGINNRIADTSKNKEWRLKKCIKDLI